MSDYNNSIVYALENALIKMKWYIQGGDEHHLKESNDWINVANIYMKEINNDRL